MLFGFGAGSPPPAQTLGFGGGISNPTQQSSSGAVNSVVNDTNVTGSVAGGVFTLGWQSTLAASKGGTGVANSATITLGGAISTANSLSTSGNNPLTITTTGTTNTTLPSGTHAVAQTDSPTFTGTITGSGENQTASSTIGGGTLIAGLTVNGGSTTTKTAVFQQAVSVSEVTPAFASTVNFFFATTQDLNVVMTGAMTLNLADGSIPGEARKAIICQDGTGSRTLTINSSSTLIWAGHTTPTFSTTANECDILSFYTTGATGTVRIFGAATTGF